MHTIATTPAAVPDVWDRRYLGNPDYLAWLTKVDTGDKAALVEFRFTAAGKPALAHIGERFRALIVPIRGA